MNRDFDNLSTLADALIPHLVDRLGGGGSATGISAMLPSVIRWSDIDKSGASLYDIPERPHGALTYKNVDDHLQYVPQAGRGGFATLDVPLYAADGTDTQHALGMARVGSMGYTDYWAGLVHRAWTGSGHYSFLSGQGGETLINAASGKAVGLRVGNEDRLSIGDLGIWHSGLSQINTDNYVSQLAGLHLGYDGSIDCRYLYTEQLHAKAFIADLEQALAGAQIITKSVTIFDQPFVAPYPGVAAALTVKDLPSAHGMQVFQANDFVRIRQFSRAGGALNSADCWGQVTSPSNNGNGTQTWTFTRSGTSTNNTIAQVANYGAASVGSGTSVVVNKPTGTASGNWIVIAFATGATVGITAPAGFTQAAQVVGTGVTLTVFQKLAGGSEPSSYTFTFASSVAYGVAAVTYSNVYTLSYTNGATTSAGTSMNFANGIPGSGNDMVVLFGGIAGNARATPPAGYTERVDLGAGSVIGIYAAEKLLSSASAPGTQTATLASSAATATVTMLVSPTFSALSATAGQMYPTTTIEPDAIVLDYGVSGNGYAEVTTVDGVYGANSPYYQIVTWTGHPATGATLKARLGNLSGITDTDFGSFAGKYGLYTSDAYLKGDFVTAGGLIRMYASSGINMQEAGGGGISSSYDPHALQWWPDVANLTGAPSLSIGEAKPTSGLLSGWNLANFDLIPNGSTATRMWLRAYGQGTGNDASVILYGGSQALGAVSEVDLTADKIVITGNLGSWSSLPYTNGGGTTWTDFGSGHQVGQYKKVGDLVFVRGLCKRTAGSGATIATLPSGYRPASYDQLFVTMTDGGVGRIDVGTGGDMSLVAGTAGWVSLNVVFSVA